MSKYFFMRGPSASIVEMLASVHSASFLLFGVTHFVKTILNRFLEAHPTTPLGVKLKPQAEDYR